MSTLGSFWTTKQSLQHRFQELLQTTRHTLILQIDHTNPQGCGALGAQGDFFLETDRLSEKRPERSAHENLTPKSSRWRGVAFLALLSSPH